MSILDEVMSNDAPDTTVSVNGALAFTPRSIQKALNNGILINCTNTPNVEIMHYVVGNVEGAVYHMFNAKLGLPLIDVLAMAYRNVFMWVRPQGPNGIYYDVYTERDFALGHMSVTLREAVGSAADAKMVAPYHDERLLALNKEEDAFFYDIRRMYDASNDRLTTIIMALSDTVAELSADGRHEEVATSSIQHTPVWLDPGDFLPGVWTPDPNAEEVTKPFDEHHPDNTPV